jgi:hypothetical protein
MRRIPWLAGLAALLTGLATGAQESREYTVDPSASDIHWLVYKAGTLSKLGHNHVISVAGLTGRVTVAGDLADSRFELSFPVASLVVDDPQLRANLGEDFASVPTAEDKAGTHRNMLTDKVLDGAKFQSISVKGTGPKSVGESQTLNITVELLGRAVELTVPAEVTMTRDTLTANGEFELTHEALGMKPFSVMLGALQVAENMKFVYRVRAEASPAKN